ncbi:3513_t:CDS:2, partial [Scutellospora calospora]
TIEAIVNYFKLVMGWARNYQSEETIEAIVNYFKLVWIRPEIIKAK